MDGLVLVPLSQRFFRSHRFKLGRGKWRDNVIRTILGITLEAWRFNNLTMRDYCVPCETDINCHVSSRNAFRIQGLFNFGKVSLVKFEILRNFALVKSNLTLLALSSAWYIIRNNNAHVFSPSPSFLPSFLSVRYKKKVNVVPGFTSQTLYAE